MNTIMFQKEISIYNGVRDRVGTTCTLEHFLFSKRHKDMIEVLRSTRDQQRRREIKEQLPQATISGLFSPVRGIENLVQHSGFICVDIDKKDNKEITNFAELKEELCKLPEIAYLSLSVGGEGYFCIIPLKYPYWHKKQFKQLEKDFLKLGITIDRACGDVTRLRCASYDENPYINVDAKPYVGIALEVVPQMKTDYNHSSDSEKVYTFCKQIQERKIDITSSYDYWMKVGAALSTLGENGREAFHICSSQNKAYNAVETDRKFNNLMRTTSQISLGTFFKICKDHLVTL